MIKNLETKWAVFVQWQRTKREQNRNSEEYKKMSIKIRDGYIGLISDYVYLINRGCYSDTIEGLLTWLADGHYKNISEGEYKLALKELNI